MIDSVVNIGCRSVAARWIRYISDDHRKHF